MSTNTGVWNGGFGPHQPCHSALDHAVWAAYGWDDPDPAAVDEDTILSRLLALNGERAV